MDQPNPTSPIAPTAPVTPVSEPVTTPVPPPPAVTAPVDPAPPITAAKPTLSASPDPLTPVPATDPNTQAVEAEIKSGGKGISFKTILLIILGVVILLLGLLYLALMLFSRPKAPEIVKVKPKPVVVEEIIETPPISKFASDSGVIQIRTSLLNLAGRIDTVDFFETQVSPPVIDTSISIKP